MRIRTIALLCIAGGAGLPAIAGDSPSCVAAAVADIGRAVFLEPGGSTRHTAALRGLLQQQGHTLVPDRGAAAVVYALDGVYRAVRPVNGRNAEIPLAAYADGSSTTRTRPALGVSVVVSPDPLTAALGTVATMAGTNSGLRDRFNEAVAGDPDGFCLAGCDRWIYQQRATVVLRRSEQEHDSRCIASASVAADTLVPEQLFPAALQALGMPAE